MRWFRLYVEVVRDPKVQTLPPDLFRRWINILCLAAERDGFLPPIDELAYHLRMPRPQAGRILAQFKAARLIDETPRGLMPHNWRGRQYESDLSTQRVRRFRERQTKQEGNVSETPPDSDNRYQMQKRPASPPTPSPQAGKGPEPATPPTPRRKNQGFSQAADILGGIMPATPGGGQRNAQGGGA